MDLEFNHIIQDLLDFRVQFLAEGGRAEGELFVPISSLVSLCD